MNTVKTALFLGVISILVLVSWGKAQSQSSELPPGVSEENWIPISDSVGIAVIGLRAGTAATLATAPDEPGGQPSAVEIPRTLYGAGVVMAKFLSEWVVFEDLAVTDPRVHQLK